MDLLLLIDRQLLSIRIHEFPSKFSLDITIEFKSVEHRFQLVVNYFLYCSDKTEFQKIEHFIFQKRRVEDVIFVKNSKIIVSLTRILKENLLFENMKCLFI